VSEPKDAPSTGGSTLVVQASLPARIADQGPVAPLVSGPQAWIDREIDDYHILRVIDAGGMGVVFLAEQHHPKRLVAIKTLHAGLHQPEMLARFQQEAEILGRLKHPGIAQIFASGRTDATLGLTPYIVMEYVEGSGLLDFCRDIGVRERLAILMRVCMAVEHAHIRGVIHRDLKPGNILVQPDGQTKVLDFGVARLTGEDQGSSELTTAGMLIGTIAYMSPEQAVGEPGAVDIRTDVYALGMIGYRMLTDSLPYDVSASSLAHALQQICETPPRPLSQHGAQFAGDLTTIFEKALAKDKAARYQNAAEFSEDLRRYLADETILARPPSALTEMRRFARRNKALVGAAVVVLLALIGAVAVSTWFALEEQAQRRQADASALEARAQAREAAGSLGYMSYVFSSANPVFAQGREVTVREAMRHGVGEVERALADAPESRARLRSSFAETYKALGDLELALQLYRAAAADFRVAGISGSELGLVRVGEARALLDSGRTREARDLLQAMVDETGADERSAPAVKARLHLAVALAQMGEDARAEAAFDMGFAQLERDAALPCPTCLPDWGARLQVWALSLRSQFEREAGRLESANVSAQRAVDIANAKLDSTDPDALVALTSLSLVQGETGHAEEARALLQRAFEDRVRLLGSEHWQSLRAADNLALALRMEGKASEAETLFRSSLEVAALALDPHHPERSMLKGNLASLLFDAGRLDEAEVLFADAYANLSLRPGPNQPDTLKNAMNLAVLYTKQQKFDKAKPLFEDALRGTEASFGKDHRQSIAVRSEYASFLRDRGQFAEADESFKQAWTTAEKLLPAGDSERLRVLYQYSGSLQKQERFAEAEQISARLMGEAKIAKDPASQHALLAPARHAKSLIGLGRNAEAETLLLELDRKLDGPANAQYRRITREILAGIYRASRREAEAEKLLQGAD
jgi:tetratricopeptide (TPR) repeat protein